jgi:hypothetical protein
MRKPVPTMWPIILLVLPFSSEALQIGTCDYSKESFYTGDSYCINPKNIASTDFSWPPLFPGTAKFVYAMDDINATEWSYIEPGIDETLVQGSESSLVGFWLEYDSVSLNNTDIEMQTELMVLYTNVSASIEGGSNGCEGLLGKECVQQINSTLVGLWSSLPDYDFPLRNLDDNAGNMTGVCPQDLFVESYHIDVRMDTLDEGTTFNDLRMFQYFSFFILIIFPPPPGYLIQTPFPTVLATEAPANASEFDKVNTDAVMPPGNTSFTYSRTLHERRPLAFQARKAAVLIMMREPVRDGETNPKIRNGTTADVSVKMVCARVAESNSSVGDGGNGGGGVASNKTNAAVMVRLPVGYTAMGFLGVVLGMGLW